MVFLPSLISKYVFPRLCSQGTLGGIFKNSRKGRVLFLPYNVAYLSSKVNHFLYNSVKKKKKIFWRQDEWKFLLWKTHFTFCIFGRDFYCAFFCLIVSFLFSGEEFKGVKLSLWTSTSNHIKHGRIELAISPSCRQFVNQAVNLLPSTTERAAALFPSPLPLDFLCTWLGVLNPCPHSGHDAKAANGFLLCNPWPGQSLWALSMLQRRTQGDRQVLRSFHCCRTQKIGQSPQEEGRKNLFSFLSCQCCFKPKGKQLFPTICMATAVHSIGLLIFFCPKLGVSGTVHVHRCVERPRASWPLPKYPRAGCCRMLLLLLPTLQKELLSLPWL